MATEKLILKKIILSPETGSTTIFKDLLFLDDNSGEILGKRRNIAESVRNGQAEKAAQVYGKYAEVVLKFWEVLAAADPAPANKVFQVTKYTKNGGILNFNGNGSMYAYADFASGELNNGGSITISGCDEGAYNGTFVVDKVHAGYGRFAIPVKFVSNPANKGSFTIN